MLFQSVSEVFWGDSGLAVKWIGSIQIGATSSLSTIRYAWEQKQEGGKRVRNINKTEGSGFFKLD